MRFIHFSSLSLSLSKKKNNKKKRNKEREHQSIFISKLEMKCYIRCYVRTASKSLLKGPRSNILPLEPLVYSSKGHIRQQPTMTSDEIILPHHSTHYLIPLYLYTHFKDTHQIKTFFPPLFHISFHINQLHFTQNLPGILIRSTYRWVVD